MPGIIAPANTGESLSAQDAALVHQLWMKGAELTAAEEDIFQGLEGSGPQSLLETEMSTATGRGQKVTFPIISEFSDEAHLGGDRFATADDFEETLIGHDTVSVDWHRFASSNDERAEEVLGMRGEIVSRTNELQGRRVGKHKCHHALMTAINLVNAENVINPKGVTGQNDILSSDTLSYDNIIRMAAMMDPMGGQPFKVGTDESGNDIRRRMLIPTTAATLGLSDDPVFKANLKDAGERGKTNHTFAGGWPQVRGNIIREWNPIDQDAEGAIGSPLNPKAWLGVPITAGTGALFITGGGNPTSAAKTKKKYFKYFPLYAYPFQKGVLLSWTTPISWQLTNGRFFVTVVNPAAAAVDPDKWCIYECSANDGNQMTVFRRLGPTNTTGSGGLQDSTVGAVAWNASVNTQVHSSRSLVYLSTNKGVPLGATPMFGARGMRRAYGKYKLRRMEDSVEGGFIKESYIVSVFGHAPRRDRDKRCPGIVVMRHAISYEGWNHPIVTS